MRWNKEALEKIALFPHLIGHLIGYSKLQDLHSYWIHYIWDDVFSDDRTLQGHRGSYKTTSTVVVGCIYWLLFHPDDRIAIIRKTFTEASKVVRVISLAFEDTAIQGLFYFAHGIKPKKVIDREGKLLFNFKQTKTQELSVEAHGLDYGITGSHYDKIICDDVITLKDRISRAEREKTKEVLKELRANIIEPNKPFVVIGTPWHRKDAWEMLPKPLKYDVYSTGILTDEEIEEKKKKTTPSLFSINYELNEKADENALFKDPFFEDWIEGRGDNYLHLDTAYDGDHYCALTLAGRRNRDGFNWQIKGWVYPGNVKDWIDFIVKVYRKYDVKVIYVEDNADKGYTTDKLRNKGLKVFGYKETENKHLKITTVLYDNWERICFARDIDEEYMEQIIDYREGQEPDDAPDSLASLLRFIAKTRTGILTVSGAEDFGNNYL